MKKKILIFFVLFFGFFLTAKAEIENIRTISNIQYSEQLPNNWTWYFFQNTNDLDYEWIDKDGGSWSVSIGLNGNRSFHNLIKFSNWDIVLLSKSCLVGSLTHSHYYTLFKAWNGSMGTRLFKNTSGWGCQPPWNYHMTYTIYDDCLYIKNYNDSEWWKDCDRDGILDVDYGSSTFHRKHYFWEEIKISQFWSNTWLWFSGNEDIIRSTNRAVDNYNIIYSWFISILDINVSDFDYNDPNFEKYFDRKLVSWKESWDPDFVLTDHFFKEWEINEFQRVIDFWRDILNLFFKNWKQFFGSIDWSEYDYVSVISFNDSTFFVFENILKKTDQILQNHNDPIGTCEAWDGNMSIFHSWIDTLYNGFRLHNFIPDPYKGTLYFEIFFTWTTGVGSSLTWTTISEYTIYTQEYWHNTYWFDTSVNVLGDYHHTYGNYTATWYYKYCGDSKPFASFDYSLNDNNIILYWSGAGVLVNSWAVWIINELETYIWDQDWDWDVSIGERINGAFHFFIEFFKGVFFAVVNFLKLIRTIFTLWDVETKPLVELEEPPSNTIWTIINSYNDFNDWDNFLTRLVNFLKYFVLFLLLIIFIIFIINFRRKW